MTTNTNNQTDALTNDLSGITLLKQRHDQIENMFQETLDATGDARSQLFDCLRATLAVHEAVEEMFVHPLARTLGDEATRIVEERLAEENQAKHTLSDLEKIGPDGEQFATQLAVFRRAVIEHAESEERELFPLVEGNCTTEDLQALADSILAAEPLAPTHPHPHAGESPLTLMVAGPFVAMVDKARDHLKKLSRQES
jgi:hemerythrin superfamily protein